MGTTRHNWAYCNHNISKIFMLSPCSTLSVRVDHLGRIMIIKASSRHLKLLESISHRARSACNVKLVLLADTSYSLQLLWNKLISSCQNIKFPGNFKTPLISQYYDLEYLCPCNNIHGMSMTAPAILP